jgi:hypothetical protein
MVIKAMKPKHRNKKTKMNKKKRIISFSLFRIGIIGIIRGDS